MSKATPILDRYKFWVTEGRMDSQGLCFVTIPHIAKRETRKLLNRMSPTRDDFEVLSKENKSVSFWASGIRYDSSKRRHTFTPLRETIVLFMAALNGEFDEG